MVTEAYDPGVILLNIPGTSTTEDAEARLIELSCDGHSPPGVWEGIRELNQQVILNVCYRFPHQTKAPRASC